MAYKNFYYDQQLRSYILQFMAIFGGMKVSINNENEKLDLIPVPVHLGTRDRVVGSILGDNTQNKPMRLPLMSANLTGINMAPERRKGVTVEQTKVYMPRGGMFPDDITSVTKRMPVPYTASFDLSVFASNLDQLYQITEQITMLFDPILQIQTSDAPFDWTRITTVELENINMEENYPMGTERRLLVATFQFSTTVYMAVPTEVKKSYVHDIYARISAISTDFVGSGEDIVAEFDGGDEDYDVIASGGPRSDE